MMGGRILIVEDDEELQELYAAMLAGMDCQITRAYDGAQALQRLEETDPDLVILDVLLDEMMGDELFLHMKKDRRYADVPIIIASVLSRERCQHLLDIDSRTRYLRKPFRKARLVAVVQKGLAGGEGEEWDGE
jgi:CheY-like chemotaxis protein